jgi:glyoxylase-like metal-dependent hydrolase (beta-lactamase superfamily II)
VVRVQDIFSRFFHAEPEFQVDGSQFDRLFDDGAEIQVGNLTGRVLHTPGHTPACVTYLFDGAAFVGDTLFMPDYGTARTDFPGGDAATLYQSCQRILQLPEDTKLYMCHDYGSEQRSEFEYLTTVGDERRNNIHIHQGIGQEEFVTFRVERDRKLAAPRLLLPSVQYNMRAGHLPPPEENGTAYFKIPVRAA